MSAVHWDMSSSSLNPDLNLSVDYSSEMDSTSTLEMINSQLIAHGFTTNPGLNFDGVANTNLGKIAKCLMGMLSQRVQDLTRSEDLTTKLRTLSYDHDRLRSMLRDEKEHAANAEREMSLHKTRHAATTRALTISEHAHKHTTAELTRTRTLLQGVRTLHISELKKRDKEIEKMQEKWTRISELQAKVGSSASGISIVGGTLNATVHMEGKNVNIADIALDEACIARDALREENLKLKRLVVGVVNDVQGVVANEPTLIHSVTTTSLFPLTGNPDSLLTASEKVTAIVSSLRDRLVAISEAPAQILIKSTGDKDKEDEIIAYKEELKRLTGVVSDLKEEMSTIQKTSYAQTQSLIDQLLSSPATQKSNPLLHPSRKYLNTNDDADMSVDLIIPPQVDLEQTRLADMRQQLEKERELFTQAAINLGREKASLEAERAKLLEEKRSWQVKMMLAELPDTPAPVSSSATVLVPLPELKPMIKTVAPLSPQRRSPAAKPVASRMVRVSRRSSVGSPSKKKKSKPNSISGGGLSPAKPRSKHQIQIEEPAYETEVVVSQSNDDMRNMIGAAGVMTITTRLLPDSFVLPAPSQHSTFPLQGSTSLLSGPPGNIFTDTNTDNNTNPVTPPQSAIESTTPASPPPQQQQKPQPNLMTPRMRPFPMAKPFAARMVHAYSPVRPSPLSRILMLANSPGTPALPVPVDSDDDLEEKEQGLGSLIEEDETIMEEDEEGNENENERSTADMFPPLSLAEELGVSDEEDENDSFPLQKKRKRAPSVPPPPARISRHVQAAKGKGRGAPVCSVPGVLPANAERVMEKENTTSRRLGGNTVLSGNKVHVVQGSSKQAVMPKRQVMSTRPPVPLATMRKVSGERKNNIAGGSSVSPASEVQVVKDKAAVKPSASRMRLMTKLPPPSSSKAPIVPATIATTNNGPRRVPIDSVEIPRGWRG